MASRRALKKKTNVRIIPFPPSIQLTWNLGYQDMIIDNDPPITRYISIPKDMDQLSCSALTAGIVEAVLDGLGFVGGQLLALSVALTLRFQPARVTAHSVPMPNLPHRTLILIKLDQSVLEREEALKST